MRRCAAAGRGARRRHYGTQTRCPDGAGAQSDLYAAYLDQRHGRSEEHTSELQSRLHLVCRLLLEKKNQQALIIIRGILPTSIDYISYHFERGVGLAANSAVNTFFILKMYISSCCLNYYWLSMHTC